MMPTLPAKAEKAVPARYATTMDRFRQTLGVRHSGTGKKRNSSTDATPANTASTRYSLRMNVLAPALIRPETSRITGFCTG